MNMAAKATYDVDLVDALMRWVLDSDGDNLSQNDYMDGLFGRARAVARSRNPYIPLRVTKLAEEIEAATAKAEATGEGVPLSDRQRDNG